MSAVKNEEGLWELLIDDQKYEFSKWGAEDSLRTLLRIGKVVGKPMGLALDALKPGDSLAGVLDKGKRGDMVSTVITALTESMDESTCFQLIQKLSTQGVFCKGAPVKSMDVHYQDRLMHLFKVAKAALEVQYGSFFDVFLASAKLSGGRSRASNPDPSTATPPSGG